MIDVALEFTACGLVFDAFGVVMLGFAFFCKTREAIKQESGSYFNYNPYALESIIKSKLDGMAGTALLLIGFIYQLLGNFGVVSQIIVTFSYGLLVTCLALYFVNFRARKVKTWTKELIEEMK